MRTAVTQQDVARVVAPLREDGRRRHRNLLLHLQVGEYYSLVVAAINNIRRFVSLFLKSRLDLLAQGQVCGCLGAGTSPPSTRSAFMLG